MDIAMNTVRNKLDRTDYMRITSLTNDIVVIDDEGHVNRFETLEAYDVFCEDLSGRDLSLYDETSKQWIVGAAAKMG